jgi:hypothetical protein
METSASFEARSAPLPYPTQSKALIQLHVWCFSVATSRISNEKRLSVYESGVDSVSGQRANHVDV